jgi:cytochrome c
MIMKRVWKWIWAVVATLLVLLAIAITMTVGWRPFIGPRVRPLTTRKFEATPQRLERGRYIVTGMSGCLYCHSPHRWNEYETPIVAGMEGAGEIEPYSDLPWRIVAPNITPDAETGAGTWSDDQLARAIREGIGHDGRALFPIMPYQRYRQMPDEDLASVIVYLRSLTAVRQALPKTEIIFPVKYLIRSVPQPLTSPVLDSDLSSNDPVRRGKRLVNLTGCSDCHTPAKQGQPIAGLDWAGGFGFPGPWGFVASVNISPDASGIPYYDEALFLDVLHTGSVKARKLSPIMPVMVYKNLSDEDLKAIFAFLRTVKPVKHRVDNSLPPTQCKICGLKHGAGDQN